MFNKYNKKYILKINSQGAKKLNDVFLFDKEIYIDRFLEENKPLYLEIREKVQKLKQRAQTFEEAINKIKNYNNTDMNLLSIMEQMENFLLYQNKLNKPGKNRVIVWEEEKKKY